MMPEWYLVILALAALSALGFFWRPLLLGAPLLVAAVGALLAQAILNAAHSPVANPTMARLTRVRLRVLTALLHLIQPLARLRGRLGYGLTPWRTRGSRRSSLPLPRTFNLWSERWVTADKWLENLEDKLRSQGAIPRRGGDFDGWDLEVRGGIFGGTRLLMAIEEHGAGKQLARFRVWPKWRFMAIVSVFLSVGLAAIAWLDHARMTFPIFAMVASIVTVRALQDCARTTRDVFDGLWAMESRGITETAATLEPSSPEVLGHVLCQSPISRKDNAIAQPKPLAIAAAVGQRTSI